MADGDGLLGGSTNGAWTCRPWLPRAPGRSGVGAVLAGWELGKRAMLTDDPGALGRLGDSWIPF